MQPRDPRASWLCHWVLKDRFFSKEFSVQFQHNTYSGSQYNLRERGQGEEGEV